MQAPPRLSGAATELASHFGWVGPSIIIARGFNSGECLEVMTDALNLDGPNPWQTRSSAVVYDNGRMRLHVDQVIQPDGAPGTYTYIELPWPVVAIVPVLEDQYVYLVRQWRYPW